MTVDANAVAVWLEGVVDRVEVSHQHDGDGVFDAIGIKDVASDGVCGCVVITEVGDIFENPKNEVAIGGIRPTFQAV